MKSFKKLPLTLAVGAALGVGVVANAQAGVLAQSVLELTGFTFTDGAGTPLSTANFSFLNFQDSSQAIAFLNGSSATNTINSSAFGTLDLPQQCVGAGCGAFGQNNFSDRFAATTTVGRADTLLQGAPITNTAGVPTPADAHVVNEVQLTAPGNGNTQANLGLTATFSFVLGAATNVGVQFTSRSHLIALLDPNSFGTARASDQWTIELRDAAGTLVFAWAPNGQAGGITGGVELADPCDLQHAVNAQVPGQNSQFNCTGFASATTAVPLTAGVLYTLGLRHAGAADASLLAVVPEPATLLLLGGALVGLGLTRRKNTWF